MKSSRTFFFMFKGPKKDLLHLTVGAPSLQRSLTENEYVTWPAFSFAGSPYTRKHAAPAHACLLQCSALA